MKLVLTTALSAFVALGATNANADDGSTGGYGDLPESEVQVLPEDQVDEESGAYGEDPAQPSSEELGTDQPIPMGEQRIEEETEIVPVIPVVPVDPNAIEEEHGQMEADEPDQEETNIFLGEQEMREEEQKKPRFGIGVSAGAGVTGFSNGDVNDLVDPGVAYTARMHLGGNSPIGLEAGYVGSAQNIDAAGLDRDAVLVSNGVEGALRLNLGTGLVQPYVLGGAAWRRYDVTNEDFNTSSVRNEDDVFEIPVGAGLSWRYGGVLVDGRGTYRFATQEDLLPGVEDDDLGLDAWNFTLRAGWEF